MTKAQITELLEKGYYFKLVLTTDKKYTESILEIRLVHDEINILYSPYINHCKSFLDTELVRLYNLTKSLFDIQFRDKVGLNIKLKSDPTNATLLEKRKILNAIAKLDYLVLYKQNQYHIDNNNTNN